MATTAKPKSAARKRTAKSTATRTGSAAKSTGARARGEKLVKDARKRGEQLLKEARKRGEQVVREAEKSMDSAREQTQKRAARLATSVVEFQKNTFDTSLDALGRLQKRSDQLVRRAVKDANWVPGEGKDVVEEWVSTMEKARADFKRATDKSFDLVLKYLKRMERGDSGAKAKSSPKAKPSKKPAARRKASTKKKAQAAGSSETAATM